MKTSVIRYRVADFLREHPPFDSFSMEHLLDFCGRGRVIFHEDDIRVFQKGEPHEADLWIIQQGRVEIIDETPAGEFLRDVLGPGDILGLRRAYDGALHDDSARTATEVILYSFDAHAFHALVNMYPEAERYVAAHLSAGSRGTKALQAPGTRERLLTKREKTSWINRTLPAEFPQHPPITCPPELLLQEVAHLRSDRQPTAVVVVREDQHPLGLITDRELIAHALSEGKASDSISQRVMNAECPTARPGASAGEYFLEMVRSRSESLIITTDGTRKSPTRSVLTDSDLALTCGRNPILFVKGILAAETTEELSYLRQRIEAFVVEELAGPTVIEWFWQVVGELNAMFIERIVQISQAEMSRAGRTEPGLRYCWLSFGRAGRQELLRPESPSIGLIYADPEEPLREDARRYFSTLTQKVIAKLSATGVRPRQTASAPNQSAPCRSVSEWEEFYRDLIHDPILKSIYSAREFFDFNTVYGDQTLALALETSIARNLRQNDAFIPILANDTLASLPPLTFFQGFIVDADGLQKQTLDLEKTALSPMVDAARVFALAAGQVSSSNTLYRLEGAAREQPLRTSIFNDARDGFCIASFQHSVAIFSDISGVMENQPTRLSRFDQRLLKAAFDSVRRLLELTTTTYSGAARDV